MRKVTICLWALFCLSLACKAKDRLDNLMFHQFSTSEGLPNNMVHHISQDKDGFIWISTFYGLFRYDGYETRTYKSNLYTPGLLANNNVLCTAEDNRHPLWIGTHEGLSVLDKRTGHIRRMTLEGINRHRVNDILVTQDGTVYCGYIRGMATYNEQQDTLLLLTAQNCKGTVPEQVNIQTVIEDEHGDLLIGTWQDGLYRYVRQTNTFIHYSLEEANSILSLFQDSQRQLWIGTNGNGVLKTRFSPDKKIVVEETFRHDTHHPLSLSSNYIYAIHEDLETHSLWFGTRNGISILPTGETKNFINYNEKSETHPFPVNEVTSIYRDWNGLMWISTKHSGIFRVDTHASAFRVAYQNKANTSLTGISTLYVEENDALWAGLEYGVDYITDNNRTQLLPTNRPYHISYSPSQDKILLALHDGGMAVCKDGKIQHRYRRANCKFIPNDLVYWIHEDRQGNWWVGTYWGLGVRYRDGREYCLSHSEHTLLGKEITCIAEDHDGTLWLATNNDGIVHITGNMEQPSTWQCKNYRLDDGSFPAHAPLCFLVDKSGRIWVGTDGSGLCLYDAQTDQFRSLHREYNLPGDMVASIEEDDYGHLWLGTNQGLARLTVTGNEQGRVRVFTVADGLLDNFFNTNASFRRGNTFYFGCDRGIHVFDSEDVTETPNEISLRITDISLDGQSMEAMPEAERNKISTFTPDFTERLTVPASYTGFAIRFASLTYNRPRQNGYAYRLQGFDEDWHYVDAHNRTAAYTQLPPGEYLFELRGTYENGDWGKIRQMEIMVEPTFWETGWAYLVYACLIGLILLSIRWEVNRRLMLHNRKSVQEGETDKVHHLKLQFVSPITTEDKKFLQEAIACVHRHLDDSSFDVAQFVNEMATSRTNLHNRLKSMTGLNTTGFVRSLRLKAACHIMEKDPHIRISDLAYQVGFNDPKYFSLCFKKEFGMQPTEYLSQLSHSQTVPQTQDGD